MTTLRRIIGSMGSPEKMSPASASDSLAKADEGRQQAEDANSEQEQGRKQNGGLHRIPLTSVDVR